jgi:hypothetical protein
LTIRSIGFPDKGSPLFRNLCKRGKVPSVGTVMKQRKLHPSTDERHQAMHALARTSKYLRACNMSWVCEPMFDGPVYPKNQM